MVMVMKTLRLKNRQDEFINKLVEKGVHDDYNKAVRDLIDIGIDSFKEEKTKEELERVREEKAKSFREIENRLKELEQKELQRKKDLLKQKEEEAKQNVEKEKFKIKQEDWSKFYKENHEKLSKIYRIDYLQKRIPKDPIKKIEFFQDLIDGKTKLEDYQKSDEGDAV